MLNQKIHYWLDGILHSYSLIFFSIHKLVALVILFVTFFSPYVGLMGLSAVLITNVLAHILGFNPTEIRSGLYGFNALFLGLALGFEFEFNLAFAVLLVIACAILLMITALLNGFLNKFGLPFLSFPFLLSYWIVSSAANVMGNIHFYSARAYTVNELIRQQASWLYQWTHSLDNLDIPFTLKMYFITLAGSFFQSSVLGGILIAASLLYFSRIVFSLSLIGFFSAYFCYDFFGANVQDLNTNLLGSNFIFLAIGVGCFYLIPSIGSYLTALCLMPIMLFILLFLNKILSPFHLNSYTLPFSIVCISFLFALQQRWLHRFLQMVQVQYFSAEKTIYKYLSSVQRFKNAHLAKVYLPFWGEWMVSQGYQGKMTHLGEWSSALDFVILDWELKTYKLPGVAKEDFYCYNKPILANMDGYVYDICNTVEDNNIAGVNTEKNWGNTIIINHLNGLFTQISHIKKDSFKVAIGDYVTRGTVLAACGNSGRSPEPHIHFQLQLSPIIGAKTYSYPIAYFIEREQNNYKLRVSEVPREGTFISNVQITSLLATAFGFTPNQQIKFQSITNPTDLVQWTVHTNAYNQAYIYCSQTKSYAYFVNDGTMFYFTDFEGDKNSLLFYFYLAAYRILLGYYQDIQIQDSVPLIHFNPKLVQWMQDFVAPFYLFTKAEYQSSCVSADSDYSPQKIVLRAQVQAKAFGYLFKDIQFQFKLANNQIQSFTIIKSNETVEYTADAK